MPAEHQAAPVVVAVELVPERETVANQHGVVPGHGDQGAGQKSEQECGQKLRPIEAPPIPSEKEIGQEHDDGQAEAGQTLGQDGEAAQDGRQVEVEGRLEASLGRIPYKDQKPDGVGQHGQHARDLKIPLGPDVPGSQLDGVDHDLWQHGQSQKPDGQIERRVVRPGEPSPAPSRKLPVLVVKQGQRAEGQGHGHGSDESHVGHGLPGHQTEHGKGRQRQHR